MKTLRTSLGKAKHLIQIFLMFSVFSLNIMLFPKFKPSAQKRKFASIISA